MLINTTKGEMDDSLLERTEGGVDNDNETTTWVEYRLDGELVHRSVAVKLKKWPEGMEAIGAKLFPGVGPAIEGVKGDSILAKLR